MKTAIWSVFVIGQGSTADMEMNSSNFCIYYTCHHLSDLKQMLNIDDIKTSKAIQSTNILSQVQLLIDFELHPLSLQILLIMIPP